MVIVLAHISFTTTRMELTDGNTLNGVRLLCNSILLNAGRLIADQRVKASPGKSVLKYEVGDEIRLKVKDFTRLSAAFSAEIEAKFSSRLPGAAARQRGW